MSCESNVCMIGGEQKTYLPSSNNTPIRSLVYEDLIKYYGDITFSKVQSPNPGLSMYAVGINSLINEKRYLFAMCQPNHYPLGFREKLSRLQWISFQARTTPTEYSVSFVSINPTETPFTTSEIYQISDDEKSITYQVHGYPIKIQLLGNLGYRTKGRVDYALQSYETVLYFD